MNNITIKNLDDSLKNLLQQRAEYYKRSMEEEAKEILRAFLTDNSLETDNSPESLNLAKAIAQRFAHFGDFELPTIARDSLREPPNFEDLHR